MFHCFLSIRKQDGYIEALIMNDNSKSDSKKRILETGLELKKALAEWDDLSKTCEGPSANEQMLKDVQVLLKELKCKIEEFDLPIRK